MRSIEDEVSSSSSLSFEIQRGNNGVKRPSHHRMKLSKQAPSKWDDAQKWLVGFSKGGEKNQAEEKARNSNADQGGEEEDSDSSMELEDTKTVDWEDRVWRIKKRSQNSSSAVRSVLVRDMGTEMTPIASQEPSRTGTPIRATTPALESPVTSPPSTLARSENGMTAVNGVGEAITSGRKETENQITEQAGNMSSVEGRAEAWDEAERVKYRASYRREEVKIEAWKNHENRKAEMEMRKMEAKAERMKARAQEKLDSKLAAVRKRAEEKREKAEAKLKEKAARTSETADYIRRSGDLPSSFSFRLPSGCW